MGTTAPIDLALRGALAVFMLAPMGCGDDAAGNTEQGTGGTETSEADETGEGSETLPTGMASSGETGESDTDDPQADVEVELLTPVEHLVRVSMALRGRRPSLDDIAAVTADPQAIGDIVDAYLDSPSFGETMMNLHNEALLVEPDYAYYPAGFPNVGPLEGKDFYEVNQDVMQAPLRLVEHVVMNDLPYTEIVTGEYTLANDTVAAVWGIPYQGSGDWEVTAWDDDRDNAGVLSDSWLWQRHRSTPTNANRGRANLVASAFVCADFTSNDVDVDVDIDLSDPAAVADAVLENPSCAACHAQLDPLASYFRGFFPLYVPEGIVEEEDPPFYPMELPWYEEFFPDILDVPMLPPAYYGEDGDGLAFLGQRIAQDPRFAGCGVRRFWSYLHQTSMSDVPDAAFDAFEPDFAASMSAKALVKAIVLHEDFQSARVLAADPQAPTEAELEVASRIGMLKVRPGAMGTMMEDLSGFRWVADLSNIQDDETGEPLNLGKVPLMQDSFLGYRVLGGGIDSMFVTQAAHTYSGPSLLVLQAVARETAHAVVEADAEAAPGDRRLFSGDIDTMDGAAVRDEMVALHLRLYAADLSGDDPAVERSIALYDAALDAGSGDARRAWKTTLSAMLSDARMAFY